MGTNLQLYDGCFPFSAELEPWDNLQKNFLPQVCEFKALAIYSALGENNLDFFELYVTPPRRVLDNKKTLEHEGLAPAAKVFCSFNKKKMNAKYANVTTIGGRTVLRPELFGTSSDGRGAAASSSATSSFPTAKAIADTTMRDSNADDGSKKPAAKPTKKKKESREETLLKRMMGRK